MENLKMKAAILERTNTPLIIDYLEVPQLQYGQVLVQVYRSGICGAQIGEIAAVKGPDKFLPHLMGHEGGGIVRDVGPGVTNVKEEDHVVMHWREGNGIKSNPPVYTRGKGKVGAGWLSTFNEYAVVSENRVTSISKEIPFEIAALMGCAVTTALGLINNEAQLKIGQSIAVFGCGGVGINVIQGASMVSAFPIIAVDIYDHKLKFAKEFGATHTINLKNSDLKDEVRKIVGGKGVDVAVETPGLVQLIEQAFQITTSGGKTILVGQPHHENDLVLHSMVQHFKGKTLFDSEGGKTNPSIDIPRYLNLYLQGKLILDPLITHRYKLDEINTAIDKIRAGEVGRCMLTIN